MIFGHCTKYFALSSSQLTQDCLSHPDAIPLVVLYYQGVTNIIQEKIGFEDL